MYIYFGRVATFDGKKRGKLVSQRRVWSRPRDKSLLSFRASPQMAPLPAIDILQDAARRLVHAAKRSNELE
jgi:hypothetical protein